VGFRARAVQAGDWACKAQANTEPRLQALAEARVHLEGVPALLMEVVDVGDPVAVGGEVSYEIRVLNQGTGPLTGLPITATVPGGMESAAAAGPSAAQARGAEVKFEPLAGLAPKEDVLYRVRARGVQPGDLRFRVQMTCDQLQAPVTKEESTRVYRP